MTQEIFNNIVDMFKKRYKILTEQNSNNYSAEEQVEMLMMGIDIEYKNPYNWMLEWFKIDKEIILYFDSVNEEWCKQYHNDKNNNVEPIFYPNIHRDFKNYVEKLNDEKYIECQEIKEKIYTLY